MWRDKAKQTHTNLHMISSDAYTLWLPLTKIWPRSLYVPVTSSLSSRKRKKSTNSGLANRSSSCTCTLSIIVSCKKCFHTLGSHGPLFAEQLQVLPPDLIKRRSRKLVFNDQIARKFERCLTSYACQISGLSYKLMPLSSGARSVG